MHLNDESFILVLCKIDQKDFFYFYVSFEEKWNRFDEVFIAFQIDSATTSLNTPVAIKKVVKTPFKMPHFTKCPFKIFKTAAKPSIVPDQMQKT